jgi:hypothetical protein
MKSFGVNALVIVAGSVLLTMLHAQSRQFMSEGTAPGNPAYRLKGLQSLHFPPSTPQRFLASEEGRAFLKATGHPLAPYAIGAFGEPSKVTVVPARWLRQAAEAHTTNAPATVPCTGSSGARFNLEPRGNAVPQNQATADFLPNRIGPSDDLIVQTANDWRGNLKTLPGTRA